MKILIQLVPVLDQRDVNELNGEMVDIIKWSEDPVVYISHALSPSDVVHVDIHEDDHSALVIFPDT